MSWICVVVISGVWVAQIILSLHQGFYQTSVQQSGEPVQNALAICMTVSGQESLMQRCPKTFHKGEGSFKFKAPRTTLNGLVFTHESPAHVSLGSSPISKNFLVNNSSNPLYIAANQ